jgi:hypothetical protein
MNERYKQIRYNAANGAAAEATNHRPYDSKAFAQLVKAATEITYKPSVLNISHINLTLPNGQQMQVPLEIRLTSELMRHIENTLVPGLKDVHLESSKKPSSNAVFNEVTAGEVTRNLPANDKTEEMFIVALAAVKAGGQNGLNSIFLGCGLAGETAAVAKAANMLTDDAEIIGSSGTNFEKAKTEFIKNIARLRPREQNQLRHRLREFYTNKAHKFQPQIPGLPEQLAGQLNSRDFLAQAGKKLVSGAHDGMAFNARGQRIDMNAATTFYEQLARTDYVAEARLAAKPGDLAGRKHFIKTRTEHELAKICSTYAERIARAKNPEETTKFRLVQEQMTAGMLLIEHTGLTMADRGMSWQDIAKKTSDMMNQLNTSPEEFWRQLGVTGKQHDYFAQICNELAGENARLLANVNERQLSLEGITEAVHNGGKAFKSLPTQVPHQNSLSKDVAEMTRKSLAAIPAAAAAPKPASGEQESLSDLLGGESAQNQTIQMSSESSKSPSTANDLTRMLPSHAGNAAIATQIPMVPLTSGARKNSNSREAPHA